MSVYFRYRGADLQSVCGSLGIGIDMIVNSQEAKLLVQKHYKLHLQIQRDLQEKEDAKYEKQKVSYMAWIEKNLGVSLRHFLKVGDQYKIFSWFRRHIVDICLWTAYFYAAVWIFRRL